MAHHRDHSLHPLLSSCVLLLAAIACGRQAPPRDTAAPAVVVTTPITERDWVLVALGDGTEPLGATARPVTLRLDPAAGRAAGSAGCNRYSGPYTRRGDSLTFGPAMMTRMACREGMDVEKRYGEMLPRVARFEARDSSLTLRDGAGRQLARFVAP